MIRPIRVAPFSQTQMISQNPLVPNTMTNEQYLSGQFASPASAPMTLNMAQQLAQTGQRGLEGAERISKQIARSPRVQGLLGGQTAGGLLSDVQGEAALQGLFGTLQAIGRPVRRGEDRFAGATQYGMQVMNQAQKRGLADLSTQMQLEKFEMDRDTYLREVNRLQRERDLLTKASSIEPPKEMMDQVSYLPKANQNMFAESLKNDALAQAYARAGLLEKAAEFSALAKTNRESAFAGQMDPAKRTETELAQAKDFQKTEYEPRYASVNAYNEMTKQAEAGGGISDYALLIKYIKVLDPNSVVREGEVTMTDQFKGFEAQLNEALRKAKGKGFDPTFRNALLDSARRNAQLAADEYEIAVERKSNQLELSGLRPDRVITTPSLVLMGTQPTTLTSEDQIIIDEIMGNSDEQRAN